MSVKARQMLEQPFRMPEKPRPLRREETRVEPQFLFFDELDSLAPRRGGVGDGGGVMERVVATLLGEMDSGSDSQNGEDSTNGRVFVIGATNRPDLLDPSLLRPGRFDRLVYLGLAQSREDRIKILVAQTRKFTFEGNQSAHAVIDGDLSVVPTYLL